ILRLTPMFWFAILMKWMVLPYLSSGPLWKTIMFEEENCSKTWWTMALYIGQFSKEGDCLPNGWYLSADMQVFLIAPFWIGVLSKRRKIGFSLLTLLVALALAYKLGRVALPPDASIWAFSPGWPSSALIPYAFGIGLGYFLVNLENREAKNYKISMG